MVIDYKKEDFENILSGYDVVLNSLDGDTLQKSLSVLKPGGKLISISGPPDPAFAREQGLNWFLSCSFVKIFARRDDPVPFLEPGIVDVCGAHGWGQSLQTTVDHTLMRGLDTA